MYGYEFDVSKVTISNKCTIRNKQLLAKNIFRYKSHCELSRDLAADAMVKALLNQPATEYNTSRLLRFMFISVALQLNQVTTFGWSNLGLFRLISSHIILFILPAEYYLLDQPNSPVASLKH